MKLCLIYNTAPRYRDAIFRAIDAEYDCDWYFGTTETDIKEMDVNRLKNVRYYKSHGNPSKIYWQGALVPCLFKKKYQSYFVLAEARSLSFLVFLILKKLFFKHKKVYGWSHGWYGKESQLNRAISKFKMKCLDGLFVYNNRSRKLMMEGGVAPNKLFTIYNSLDYNEQLNLRESISKSVVYSEYFGNHNPVIVFVGRLTEVKRLDLLLYAINLLKKRGQNYNVVLIGSGVMEKQLKDMTLKLDVPAWFYGACYDERTNAELIFNADLCVSPGNVGLTAIHSLMFGTPVITHNDFNWQMPEYEAIKQGVTGDFFERDNFNSLAEKISLWFSNNHNREDIRQACYNEIDTNWNPVNQMRIIKENLKI